MKYLYLLVNFFTIIIPFVFSFHPRLRFHKTWYAFFPAVITTGIFFIAWDMVFTGWGIWGFNPQYLTGVQLYNLPIEEVLFFFCIPYACVFTFHCLDIFINRSFSKNGERIFSLLLAGISFALAFLFLEKWYTTTTFFVLGSLVLIAGFFAQVSWLMKFYIIYGVLLFPFFIVNGVLTGTGLESPVVWYNDDENLGIRLLTIPVEDVFYGMALILMNVLIYRHLMQRKSERQMKKNMS